MLAILIYLHFTLYATLTDQKPAFTDIIIHLTIFNFLQARLHLSFG